MITRKHKVDVRAWDSTGAYGTATFYSTIGSSTPTSGEPMPPSGAKLIDNIDQQRGGHCTHCAADPREADSADRTVVLQSVPEHAFKGWMW